MSASLELRRLPTPAVSLIALKRAVDILGAAFGLIALAPLLLGAAMAIRLGDGGPALFRQTRLGRGGRSFQILKFRSMTVSGSGAGSNLTVAGDKRITRVGAVLRRTKLDELPQLFNVLRGDMSLVGPRPETPDLAAQYSPAERAVMAAIRPGVTDYASLLLRDENALLARAADPSAFYRERLIPLKAELCARYVEALGPLTDVRIILATLVALVAPDAAAHLIDPALARRFAAVCSGAAADGPR